MRGMRDASWRTSHDGRKHVKCTRDENGFTRPIDSKGVLEYDILKRYVLEKPPSSLYTTLIDTNRHSR
jgi:hypothetical protein